MVLLLVETTEVGFLVLRVERVDERLDMVRVDRRWLVECGIFVFALR